MLHTREDVFFCLYGGSCIFVGRSTCRILLEYLKIAFQKKEPLTAIPYLEKYLVQVGDDVEMNNNLLMLYVQSNQIEKAQIHSGRMEQLGLAIPNNLKDKLK